MTQADLDYVGSITIDADLLRESGIIEYEKVEIADINNGNRFATYVIAGEAGSGIICLNGAAAKCVNVGDKVTLHASNGCQVTGTKTSGVATIVAKYGDTAGSRVLVRFE